jgi:LAGLIDADG DNA endonuclease family
MVDGFKSGNGICLCTESFTLAEVELLKKVLEFKFGLTVTIQIRNTSSGTLGYRLYISSRKRSRDKLLSLIKSYFIHSMINDQ